MFRRPLLLLLPPWLFALASGAGAVSPSTGDLTGVIRDSRNKGIPQVRVRFFGPAEGTVRTDAAGRYGAGDLPPGDYEVFFQKPGYLTVRRAPVRLRVDAVTELSLRLEWADAALGALEVATQTRTKEPLPGTTVELIQNGFPVAQSQTDETGTVVFPGLAPGVFRVQARRPGFRDSASGNFRVRAGLMTTAAARLQRDGEEIGGLEGTVRSLAGDTIAGATVRIIRGLSAGHRVTGTAGRYGFADLIPGDGYALEASASGFQTRLIGGIRVVLREVVTQDFTLVPAAATKGSLSGTVRDEAGEAVPLARVELTAGPEEGREVEADGLGRYTLPELTPGEHSVVARTPGFNPAGRSGILVSAGRTSVADLVLAPRAVVPGSLAGTVREEGSGNLLSGVVVELAAGPSAGLATSSDLSGAYVLPGIIPDAGYAVRFRKDGYAPAMRTVVEVASGSQTALNISLAPLDVTTGNIEGAAARLNGTPLPDVKVTLFRGPTSPVTTKTDSEGRFTLRGLEAGSGYGLRLEKTGFTPLEKTQVRVDPGRVTRLGELTMTRTTEVGTLRVQVIDLLGRGIPGAGVTVIEGPSRPPRSETDAGGRAALAGLQPGTYTIEVVANGFQNGRRGFLGVLAGRTTDTTVQLLR